MEKGKAVRDGLSLDDIKALHLKVQDGEIEPYEDEESDWADILYELAEEDHIRAGGVEAAIQYLKSELDAEVVLASYKFKEVFDNYYKASYPTKGAYAREYISTATNHDDATVAEFSDYIDWNRYADDKLSGDCHFIQLEEDGDVYVFDNDPDF
jgi:hypothetical protein